MQNENDIVTLRVQVNFMEGIMIKKKKKLSLTKRRFGTNSHQPLKSYANDYCLWLGHLLNRFITILAIYHCILNADINMYRNRETKKWSGLIKFSACAW